MDEQVFHPGDIVQLAKYTSWWEKLGSFPITVLRRSENYNYPCYECKFPADAAATAAREFRWSFRQDVIIDIAQGNLAFFDGTPEQSAFIAELFESMF